MDLYLMKRLLWYVWELIWDIVCFDNWILITTLFLKDILKELKIKNVFKLSLVLILKLLILLNILKLWDDFYLKVVFSESIHSFESTIYIFFKVTTNIMVRVLEI